MAIPAMQGTPACLTVGQACLHWALSLTKLLPADLGLPHTVLSSRQ